MKPAKRYLVTSALPYANGPLHIGHLSGAVLSADIYVRFRRLMGDDILYVCGSDEHGAAITIRAKKEGTSPQEIIDKYHTLFVEAFDKMGVSFDLYHRTSEPLHHKTAGDFFKVLYDKGEFVVEESEQYFDKEANQFLADRYIKGTCPKCEYDEAYGDQCEKCGSTLSPNELINPQSTLTGNKPIKRKTKHWYLPLDKYENWLKEYIDEGILDNEQHHYPDEWKNHVIGQCDSWIDSGLHPRAMTRDLDWGVDLPKGIPDGEGKKLYVWMDAPIGYISATKAWANKNNEDWEKYWKDDETSMIHFIGKDNIVFHCLIFPALLKAHGGFNLPINVPANQFMNLEGRKISTSKNWAVWVNDYVVDMAGREDELRYYLTKNMPEQRDSEFTWEGFQDANNNELVNNLANFINRVVVLTNKYYDGKVPAFDENQDFLGPDNLDEGCYHDSELLRLFDDIHVYSDQIRKFNFRGALTTLMGISAKGNQILQYNEPWKLIKEDPEKVKTIMNLLLHYITALSVIIRPFLPFTSDKMRVLLQLSPIDKEEGQLLDLLNDLAEGIHLLESDHQIGEATHLFSRMDNELIQKQVDKLKASEVVNESKDDIKVEIKKEISFDDFMKLDIRTATILEAEKVPKTSKLLKIELDLGFEKRTVVSGIAQSYNPDEIIGKQVSVLCNLAPRKIKGVLSNGMILMSENKEGKLVFINPDIKWEIGSSIS